ncbi:hypothetical protein FACS1894184_10340 [Clostridia bacterium]|nr:hypothetical protein FACS1894184_10340 [Clostridia bacterium]
MSGSPYNIVRELMRNVHQSVVPILFTINQFHKDETKPAVTTFGLQVVVIP